MIQGKQSMRTLTRIAAAALALSAVILNAQAATSTAIGEVSILGTNYKVSLLSDANYESQSFTNLAPTITFTNLSDAQAAASALLAKFGSSYNWNPTCIDCYDGVRVAYGFDATDYDFVTVVDASTFGPFQLPSNEGNAFSFAQFTTAVPEASAAPMMLVGLGVIGAIALRRRPGRQLV